MSGLAVIGSSTSTRSTWSDRYGKLTPTLVSSDIRFLGKE
jgi:hypothetical protein